MTGDPTEPDIRLYFVRHGETEWSLNGRHTGHTDIPLTPHGETEARALVPWMSAIVFAHVFASPRRRARRTCELAGLGPGVRIEPDLAEWDYGDYEGVSSKDIARTGPDWALFKDGAPGGESPADVTARADRLIARLCALHGNIALFSHGQFGSAFGARWNELAVLEGRRFTLSTASLSILGFSPGHPGVRSTLLWNAVPAMLAVPPA
jgi:probable phosphoglycerate mutase